MGKHTGEDEMGAYTWKGASGVAEAEVGGSGDDGG